MRKGIFISLTLVFSLLSSISLANAIQNGQVTEIGKYVIPVQSSKSWCSGVAISTRVVITNGHCTRLNNQIFSDISVGYPGSNQYISSPRIKVIEIITEPTFSYGSDRLVPKDDIAFLILESDLPSVSVTRVATEADILEMRSKGAILLLQGYGLKGEGSVANNYSSFPSNGFFTIDNWSVFDATLQSISSRTFSACNGDSGAPVIWENGKEAILLGVNVGGGGAANSCRKISSDGLYRTEVQIPSRHPSLLVNSIIKSTPAVGASLKAAIEEKLKLEKELSELRNQSAILTKDSEVTKQSLKIATEASFNLGREVSELRNQSAVLTKELEVAKESLKIANDEKKFLESELSLLKDKSELMSADVILTKETLQYTQQQLSLMTSQNNELQTHLNELKNKVQELTKLATTTITCLKGSTSRKITGINPVCPVGFKRK